MCYADSVKRRYIISVPAACIVALCILAFVRGMYRIASPQLTDTGGNAQYVIVLGGGQKKGMLGESAVERVKTAAQYMKTHTASQAIVSGGRGRWGDDAESTLLKKELSMAGIDEARVLEEGQSADTVDNLRYSAMVIAKDKGENIEAALQTPVVIVTSGYHLSRAAYIARRLGYSTVGGIAAQTPGTAVVRSWMREVAAWVKLDMVQWTTGKPRNMLLEDGGERN